MGYQRAGSTKAVRDTTNQAGATGGGRRNPLDNQTEARHPPDAHPDAHPDAIHVYLSKMKNKIVKIKTKLEKSSKNLSGYMADGGRGVIRLIVGFQSVMVISPTASWIRWCMQVYACELMWTGLLWAERSTPDIWRIGTIPPNSALVRSTVSEQTCLKDGWADNNGSPQHGSSLLCSSTKQSYGPGQQKLEF